MTLEKTLLVRRNAMCMTQSKLAKLVNISTVQFISNVEREKCKWPKKTFPKLARALKIDISEIVKMRAFDFKCELEREFLK